MAHRTNICNKCGNEGSKMSSGKYYCQHCDKDWKPIGRSGVRYEEDTS